MTPTDRNLPRTPTTSVPCLSESNHYRYDGVHVVQMNSSLNIQGQSSQQQQQCSTSIPGHPGREGWQALPTGDFLPPNYTVLNNDVFDHPSPNDAILLCSQMENALANERAKRMEAERLIAQNIADWTRRLSELEGEWQSKLGTAGHGQLPPQESERKSNVVDAGIQVASEAQREDGVLLKECKHRLREAEIWLSKAKLGSSNENLHGCGKGCCSSNGSDSVSLEKEEIKAFKVELIRLMDDLSIQILHHQEKTKHRQKLMLEHLRILTTRIMERKGALSCKCFL